MKIPIVAALLAVMPIAMKAIACPSGMADGEVSVQEKRT